MLSVESAHSSALLNLNVHLVLLMNARKTYVINEPTCLPVVTKPVYSA